MPINNLEVPKKTKQTNKLILSPSTFKTPRNQRNKSINELLNESDKENLHTTMEKSIKTGKSNKSLKSTFTSPTVLYQSDEPLQDLTQIYKNDAKVPVIVEGGDLVESTPSQSKTTNLKKRVTDKVTADIDKVIIERKLLDKSVVNEIVKTKTKPIVDKSLIKLEKNPLKTKTNQAKSLDVKTKDIKDGKNLSTSVVSDKPNITKISSIIPTIKPIPKGNTAALRKMR